MKEQAYNKMIFGAYVMATTIFTVALIQLAYFRITSGNFGFDYALSTFVAIAMAWWVVGSKVKD